MPKLYEHIALGGTFDLMHAGHKKLLLKAFWVGKRVTIGITSDKFTAALGLNLPQNQLERKKILSNFLNKKKLLKRAKLVFIEDIYGPTLVDSKYLALAVSGQTYANAVKVNEKRRQLGLPKLEIVTVPFVKAYDGMPISSTRIRAGEIDEFGRSYQAMLKTIAGKSFADTVRKKLKKPFGKIVKVDKLLSKKPNIITIGDVSTVSFNSLNIRRKLSVVDFLTNRKKVYDNLSDLGFKAQVPFIAVKNPSGQISKGLVLKMSKALRSYGQNQVILVEGEEDLAAVCAVLLAPIPSTVFYGQPKMGQVMVDVDLDAKNRLCGILRLR